MNARELVVNKGDPIAPAWRRLQEWAKSYKLIQGAGVRFHRTPAGTLVTADIRRSSWLHPFLVNIVGDDGATVRLGTVKNLVPRIRGKRIDNLDDDGREADAPILRLTGGPGPDLSSFVALTVLPDIRSGLIDPLDREAIEIIHAPRLSDFDPGAVGVQPLARLAWTPGGQVRRAFQIVHHNLEFQFIPASTKTLARAFFWAV